MAYTVSHLFDTVFGDKRVSVQRVTPDAAEGVVATRLKKVDFAMMPPLTQASFVASGNTSQTYPTIKFNQGTTATAINGSIGISGVVASNVYLLVSFGS